MIKRPPSPLRIAAMVAFALSCFGVLTFLWISFGGTVPLKPKGYRFDVAFRQAGQLAQNADVRIAGITVGHVVKLRRDPAGNHTLATVEVERQYAPIHRDARAILRAKTLAGEVYVEITPGSRGSPLLPDRGRLANSQVVRQVQLEDILDAFDPRTRQSFRVWQRDLGAALNGSGRNLNDAFGSLPVVAEDATDVLAVLDSQRAALGRLVRNGGVVFRALSRNRAALRGLVVNSGQVFQATADEREALALSFAIFPTFLDETRATQARLDHFSRNADPLVRDLRPPLRDLRPTLRAARLLAPGLRRLFADLRPLIDVSSRGLPALRDTIHAARPLLGSLGPFLEQLNPVLQFLERYQHLTADFISQGSQALQATIPTSSPGSKGHYLRQINPTGAENATVYRDRLPTNRGNAYIGPIAIVSPPERAAHFLDIPSWDCMNTGAPGNGETLYSEDRPSGHASCWLQENLPFQGRRTHFTFVHQAHYGGR